MAKNIIKNKVKTLPLGVKIISILTYISAAILLIGGIVLIAGSAAIAGFLVQIMPILVSVGASLFIVLGIVLIAFAVLDFFIARGLWKLQNWARIVTIVFSVLGILSALNVILGGQIFNGLINLIINGVIVWYLGFNARVKQAFS